MIVFLKRPERTIETIPVEFSGPKKHLVFGDQEIEYIEHHVGRMRISNGIIASSNKLQVGKKFDFGWGNVFYIGVCPFLETHEKDRFVYECSIDDIW